MSETELNTQELQEYLGQISKLETSIYNQEKIFSATQNQFAKEKPEYTFKPKHGVPMPELPKEPEKPVKKTGDIIGTLVGGIVSVAVGVLLLIFDEDLTILPYIPLILGVLMWFATMGLLDEKKKEKKKYKKEYAAYPALLEEAKEARDKIAYENYTIQLNNEKMEAEYSTRFESRMTVFTENKGAVLGTMGEHLATTKNLLAKLYGKNIIFEKYRNMFAMTTIYEYFASGRVSSLTGPNGAYNLYETELRQNIVISELQSIGNNLEQIKANQYTLYTEIQKGNRELSMISSEVYSIARSTSKIEAFSELTAYYSSIAAVNSEATFYLK